MENKIRVGISECLLGHSVRYDGGHKLNPYITGILGQFFDFVYVCPEVECGLPVPREALNLNGDPSAPRMITARSNIDHTEKMIRFCSTRIEDLKKENLCGFIFKSKSPSCGLYRIKVYQNSKSRFKSGRGLFAAALVQSFPLLPVEDEGRLNDPGLRENFIEKVFCCRRWKDFMSTNPDYKKLIDFHARHKLQLMSHSTKQLARLGKLVAAGKTMPADCLLSDYEINFVEALSQKATVKKNVNVLHHIIGYFKKLISADEKEELLEIINHYALHQVPLIVPLTLINHYIRKYEVDYLGHQTYLQPHPAELMLRNHV
ncbi:MAG TPA: DUF1722 domain-containing protein [Firmicutes bacterium]|nr:DUF1722 domain-containing protein [Bacillota bacterium]